MELWGIAKEGELLSWLGVECFVSVLWSVGLSLVEVKVDCAFVSVAINLNVKLDMTKSECVCALLSNFCDFKHGNRTK